MPDFQNPKDPEPSAQGPTPIEASAPSKSDFRLGKDEMNLVEHPFALLKRGATDSVIHLEWDKIHPRTGKTIQARWRVSGDSQLGLPGPVEERLYLVLMELSREQGFPQRVIFSRNDVLERLGLTKGAKNYATLHDAFLRLKTVSIDAKRSFWNVKAQDFSASVMFNILDEVDIVDEAPGRRKGQIPLALSSFKWSDVMFTSLEAGNIRSMDIQFTLSLQLPLSARLFRYLDKHRTAGATTNKSKFEIELHRLCEIHLGMARSNYASKLKERLLPALEELKARGFLLDWTFEPMKTEPGEVKSVFYFSNASLERVAGSSGEALAEGDEETAPPAPDGPSFHGSSSDDKAALALPGLMGLVARIDSAHGSSAHTSWHEDEASRLDAACDAAFETLSADEQAGILARAREALPPFLRDKLSLPGARVGIDKERRAIVWCQHKEAVYAVLRGDGEDEAQADEI